MGDPFRWSISLGRWGVPVVRVHIFFLVFMAATYYLCWQDARTTTGSLVDLVTIAMVSLFVSSLLHEWSHWAVARRHELAPDTLVIGPLGGVSDWPHTTVARGGLTTMLAGPAANLFVCLICAATLWTRMSHIDWIRWFNPLEPVWNEQGTTSLTLQFLQLTLWINWVLFLVNLLPAFPFDGGRILRTLLHRMFPEWKSQRVAEMVYWFAVVFSAAMMFAALALLKQQVSSIFPTSFALLLLAVVLLVSARRDFDAITETSTGVVFDTELESPWPDDRAIDELDELDEDDFDDDNADDDEYASPFSSDDEQWLANPAVDSHDKAEPSADEIEAEEERLVDAILSRLHARGLDSLTSDERALLERVSARYRNRLGRRT